MAWVLPTFSSMTICMTTHTAHVRCIEYPRFFLLISVTPFLTRIHYLLVWMLVFLLFSVNPYQTGPNRLFEEFSSYVSTDPVTLNISQIHQHMECIYTPGIISIISPRSVLLNRYYTRCGRCYQSQYLVLLQEEPRYSITKTCQDYGLMYIMIISRRRMWFLGSRRSWKYPPRLAWRATGIIPISADAGENFPKS